MDTNALQILAQSMQILAQSMAQQKAAAIPVAGRSAVEITLLILAAASPLILAFAGWIKAQSFQTDLKEVKEKVNGALESMKALAHEKGMDNGRALERGEQAKVQQTVDAVKEAIKVRESPPVTVLTQEQIVEAIKKMPPTI